MRPLNTGLGLVACLLSIACGAGDIDGGEANPSQGTGASASGGNSAMGGVGLASGWAGGASGSSNSGGTAGAGGEGTAGSGSAGASSGGTTSSGGSTGSGGSPSSGGSGATGGGSGYVASLVSTTCPSIPSSGYTKVTTSNHGSVLPGSPNQKFVFEPGTYKGITVSPKSGQKFYARAGVVFVGNKSSSWSGSGSEYAFKSDADNVYICGFKISNYHTNRQRGALNAQGGQDSSSVMSSGWIIENVEVYGNLAGVTVGSNSIFRNSWVHNNDVIGLKASWTKDAVFDNVEVNNNGENNPWGWGDEGGGSKFSNTTNLVVRNSYVHHNAGPGLWTDINNKSTLYEDNLVESNGNGQGGPGIFHEISFSAVIRNNVVKNNGLGSSRGWLWDGGIDIAASQDVEVYGNTLENNKNGIGLIQQDRGAGYIVQNNWVHHNTIKNSGKSGAVQDISSNGVFSANNKFDHNTYTGGSWEWNNGTRNWSYWQNTAKQDPNGVSK